jgi:hypothetical protein
MGTALNRFHFRFQAGQAGKSRAQLFSMLQVPVFCYLGLLRQGTDCEKRHSWHRDQQGGANGKQPLNRMAWDSGYHSLRVRRFHVLAAVVAGGVRQRLSELLSFPSVLWAACAIGTPCSWRFYLRTEQRCVERTHKEGTVQRQFSGPITAAVGRYWQPEDSGTAAIL